MNDKQLLELLGITDTRLSIELDEDIRIAIEHKIDDYLKKIDEEQKRKAQIEYLKQEHEQYKKKKEFLNMFNDSYVYKQIKHNLIKDGAVFGCPTCRPLDLSGQYGRPLQTYKSYYKHNWKNLKIFVLGADKRLLRVL